MVKDGDGINQRYKRKWEEKRRKRKVPKFRYKSWYFLLLLSAILWKGKRGNWKIQKFGRKKLECRFPQSARLTFRKYFAEDQRLEREPKGGSEKRKYRVLVAKKVEMSLSAIRKIEV